MAEAATVAVAAATAAKMMAVQWKRWIRTGVTLGGPIGRVYPADWATKTKAVASAATAVVAAAATVEKE